MAASWNNFPVDIMQSRRRGPVIGVDRELADLVIDPDVRGVGLLHWHALRKTADTAHVHTMADLEARGVSYDSLLREAAAPG
jgi:hypothetical protein